MVLSNVRLYYREFMYFYLVVTQRLKESIK